MKPELLREAPVNTQGNLNIERIGSRGIALPPATEQQRIVLQIERDTRETSETINRTKREIALLQEYRARLTADVVTGKLDIREAAARLSDEAVEPQAIDDAETLDEFDEDTRDEDLEDAVAEAEA